GGNGRGCVSVIHSLAECQATAHQETAFSVLHRKVRSPPESVPASSLRIFMKGDHSITSIEIG
ncbi:hypothetical protein, partial [Salmonella enterica]|uniref:hypothetical protein n=1 Tax=Salmonella enterica TaxID=28901 RepID=UPI003F8B7B8E